MPEAPPRGRGQTLLDAILIAAFAWLCHFQLASGFGLYEDDWWRVPLTADIPFKSTLRLIADFLLLRNSQGRPLHDGLIHAFSFLGWRTGGLAAHYWIAWAILSATAILFHALFLRLSGQRLFALAAALALIAYPPDTTRQYLTHAFGVTPSLAFLLIAWHLWISGRKVLAHVAALGCLLCYEPFYPVFLAVPLCEAPLTRRRLRSFATHALTVSAILGAAYVLRGSLHEARVAKTPLSTLISKAADAIFWGPVISIRQHAAAILEIDPAGITPLSLLLILAAGAAMAWRLTAAARNDASQPQRLPFRNALLAGLVLIVIAYPITFTTSPHVTSGRASRVHAAAAPGAALLIGAAASSLFRRGSHRRWAGPAVAAAFAGYFSLLAAYGIRSQNDYVSVWSEERSFWRGFLEVLPPAAPGTIFIMHRDVPPGIQPQAWTSISILERIFVFPSEWVNLGMPPALYRAGPPPPRLFPMYRGIPEFCAGQDLFQASEWVVRDVGFLVKQYRELPPSIYLLRRHGPGKVTIEAPCPDRPMPPQPPTGAVDLAKLPHRPMYRYLIGP